MINSSINSDSHLLHITRGKGEITLNKIHKFSLCQGTVIAIPRGTSYVMKISKNFEMLNLHYQIWLENGQYMDERLRLPYFSSPDYFNECEQKLRKMRILSGESKMEVLQKSSLAYQIIMEHLALTNLIEIKRDIIDERIDRAANYLNSKVCHSYDIKTVTRIACLSKSQLNRKFKQAFGIPPHQYWEQQRLREACLQIKQTGKNFAEIAEFFNFSSPDYFSRWFRKNISCSPSAFRNSQVNY